MVALTREQMDQRALFAAFVDDEVMPHASAWDDAEGFPPQVVESLAKTGLFAVLAPESHGGTGADMTVKGLLCEEIGRGSGSLLSLITVHGIVCSILEKWGTPAQKDAWLPGLADGTQRGAFALTEPDIGSDAKNVTTTATPLPGGGWSLSGNKKWISGAAIADVYIVCGKVAGAEAGFGGGSAAFIVPRNTPGLTVKPMKGLLGFRAAHLAELSFEDCLLPEDALVGRVGFGFSHVTGTGLDSGRFSIAWGCVGLIQACIDASLDYARTRTQFNVPLIEHQLIQGMIADMLTDGRAARAICMAAGERRALGDPGAIMEISIAKQFTARAALKAATDAVQIHGGNGCGPDYPVQRYFRDAKVMEIIEGSSQIQQMIIARHGADATPYGRKPDPAPRAAETAASAPPSETGTKPFSARQRSPETV
ncbi:MAG: acyl-CoA dehydrogenase family protein [Rhodospirillaceae bacterium]